MLLILHSKYKADYPETFKWIETDCHERGLIRAAIDISSIIVNDLKTNERNLTPGLRAALNIIAGHMHF